MPNRSMPQYPLYCQLENTSAGLRIEVTDDGCSGYQYGLKLEGSHTLENTVINCGDVKVFIDPDSMPRLDGMLIDFLDSTDGSGFKFTNPNAAKSCACGTSFNTSTEGTETKTCS
ncbi:MAG: iron-sulfur cluster assembly accessory protein [Methylococcales bacterium]|nr:iron-sulfur cluster assembly accessory protein [Methylococcales bacterium]